MGTILFLIVLGLGLMLFLTRADMAQLRRRIDELEDRPFRFLQEAEAQPELQPRVLAKTRKTATVVSRELPRELNPLPVEEPEPEPAEPRPSPFADLSFESLVGGKLPIWVGGIALVFAGFFLVRYTIEAGLFGPAARSVTATLFAFAMIAMSELGGRLPKIGASFTADPRVGQSLAGAGVATLYGTLYMASEIYGLVVLPTSFVLVLVVTAIAFALSLRHGPPTALMGLVGGFAAPWVAGMGASELPTLLLYLAVFIAALFGLAIWRRWLWLLVLASGGGLLWSFAMLATANADLALLGGFIVLTGAGALLAAQRFDDARPGWNEARLAPMALALVQLAILLPRMDFSATGWLFYFALSALSVVLAWRDRKLLPLVGGALLISVAPLVGAWSERGADGLTIAGTIAIALLFGVAGQLRARQTEAPVVWALIGLAAPIFCWFAAAFTDTSGVSNDIWGLAAALAMLASGFMAWDQHVRAKNAQPVIQASATAAGALMALMAWASWFPSEWAATYAAITALGVAAWARATGVDHVRRIAVAPLATAMLVGAALSYQFLEALGASLSGARTLFEFLPPMSEAIRTTLIPAVLILAITWQPFYAAGRKTRVAAFAVGGAGVTAFIWLVAKQPAAISTPGDFIRLGFAERAVFTQILFGLGWLALGQAKARSWPSLATAGWVLAGLALFRIFWFDMLLLNPVMVPQAVGPVPIANLATAHVALTALWLWLLARHAQSSPERGGGAAARSDDVTEGPPSTTAARRSPSPFRGGLHGLSLGAMIAAVLVSVRQAVQGNLLSGASIETGENYLYSAGLLALSLVWLVLGMVRGVKLLRVAGLSLLTLTTLKVFLIDAAALTGLLRILSFLGLGIALIGIGWAYGRVISLDKAPKAR